MPSLIKEGELGYKIYRNIYAKTQREFREWSQVDSSVRDCIILLGREFSQLKWVVTELWRTSKENAALYRKRNKPIPPYTYHQDGLAADIRKRTISGGVSVEEVVRFINEEVPGTRCVEEGDHLHIQPDGRRGAHHHRGSVPDGQINNINFIPAVQFTEAEIEQATYTIQDEENRQPERLIPNFLKDPPNSKKPGATQIGDTWLTVPPLDISIDTTDSHYSMETLRSQGSPKINTGTSVQEISLVLEFPSSATINFELRHIVAQFKRTPFTTVRNELLSKALTPIVGGPDDSMELIDGETTGREEVNLVITKEYQSIPVVLKGISVATIPGFPDSLQATLTVHLFNHVPYYPSFGFVPTTAAASRRAWDNVQRQNGKLINDATTAVADVSESPLYRRYYYGLLPEYNNDPNSELFDLDEFGHDASSYLPSNLNLQLNQYNADDNEILQFEYQYTADTILSRLQNRRSALQAKQEILVKMMETKDGIAKLPEGAFERQWHILNQEIKHALELPGRMSYKLTSAFPSMYEKLRAVIENVGDNPSQRIALQTNFETAEIERIEVRLNEMIKEHETDKKSGIEKIKDIVKIIVEAYNDELLARQGSKPRQELFIIGGNTAGSLNGQNIPGYAKITGISATYDNPISQLPIAQYNVPTMQHMGVGEFSVTINIETDSIELIKQVRVMNALLTHTSFVTNVSSVDQQAYLDTRIEMSRMIQGHLLRALGISSLIIQNISISNIKGTPGSYNISISMQQADLLVFQAEQLRGTKGVTQEMLSFAFNKISLWVSDRVNELDPNTSSEGRLDEKYRGTRPSGVWSDLIEEAAQEFIKTSAAFKLHTDRKRITTLLEESQQQGGFFASHFTTVEGNELLIPTLKLKDAIEQKKIDLIDKIHTHNIRSKIIKYIEHEPSRLSIGDIKLDDLYKAQLAKQMRGDIGIQSYTSPGAVKGIHTCYPDLDLPIINGTNLYTSPAFYLHSKNAMTGHIFSRVKNSLNHIIDKVKMATIANKAIVADMFDELKAIMPLDESYTFEHRGVTHEVKAPKGSTFEEVVSQIEALFIAQNEEEGRLPNDPRGTILKSKAEHFDFVMSVKEIQILRLLTMQGVASSLFKDVKFAEIKAADNRDVTKELARRWSPTDRKAVLNALDRLADTAVGGALGLEVADQSNIATIRNFAEQLFEDSGTEYNNELMEIRAKETVQNLMDEYIRMSQGLEFEADQITKYYGLENWNSVLRKIDVLRRAEEIHKADKTGSYDRAFPTFKLYFIEEDASNWKLFDDFYSYSAVNEISIIKSKRAASDVAIIRVSNISGILTNPNAVRDAEVTAINTIEEQDLRSLFLRPGISVAIRMGYGTDPMSLPLVFMGSVTEVPAGPDIEIVCQGWGAELYNPVGTGSGIDIGWNSFDKALGDVASRVLNETGDGLDHFGRWSIFNEPDKIRHSGQRRWAESILSSLGADFLASAVGKSNNLSENIYLSYNDSLLPWTNNTFDWKIFNQTAWDALQEICLYVPNYVVRPMYFNDQSSVNYAEQRMTLYLGPKDGFYKFTDDPLITNLAGQTKQVYESEFLRKRDFEEEELLNFVTSDIRALQTGDSNVRTGIDEGILADFVTDLMAKDSVSSLLVGDTFLSREFPLIEKLTERGYLDLVEWLNTPVLQSTWNRGTVTPFGIIVLSVSSYTDVDDIYNAQIESLVSLLEGTFPYSNFQSYFFGDTMSEEEWNRIEESFKQELPTILANDAVRIIKRGDSASDQIDHENVKGKGQEFARKFYVKHPHYRPFQGHWMVDSYRHIINNNITADAEGMANEVVLTFPPATPVMVDPRIGLTTFESMNKAVRSYRAVVDDDIKSEYRRVVQTFQKNIDTNWYDELGSFLSVKNNGNPSFLRSATNRLWIPSYIRVANTVLANHLAPMYTGELCIMGNAAMKPYDVVYIQDDYNDMQGPIEIDTVIHKMSRREGFTTKITPSAVVYQQSYSSLLDPDFIQWEWYKGFMHIGYGAIEGLTFGIGIRSVAKAIAPGVPLAAGEHGPLPKDSVARFLSARSGDGVTKTLGKASGRGLLALGKRAPLIGTVLGGYLAFDDALDTWTGAVGRLFGGNVVNFSGLWLNGQVLQAGLDGLRQNTIQDHRMSRFKHGINEMIYPIGGAAGREPGLVAPVSYDRAFPL